MSKPILPPDDAPPANEYGKRRSYAARLGMCQAQFAALFGSQGNPKNRRNGAADCAAWVRDLPKAQPKQGGKP